MHSEQAKEFFKQVEQVFAGKDEAQAQALYLQFLEDIIYRAKNVTTLIISRLPIKQSHDLYHRVKQHLAAQVKRDVWRFNHIMTNIKDRELRNDFFELCTPYLQPSNSDEFESILTHLTKAQRTTMYQRTHQQLLDFCIHVSDFNRITHYLSPKQHDEVLSSLQRRAKPLSIAMLKNFNTAMRRMSEKQRADFYALNKQEVLKRLDNPSIHITHSAYNNAYKFVRKYLLLEVERDNALFISHLRLLWYPQSRSDFYEQCTKHLPQLKPQNAVEFNQHALLLPESMRSHLYLENCNQLSRWCNTVESFKLIVSHLNTNQKTQLINSLAQTKQPMNVPIDKDFYAAMMKLTANQRNKFAAIYLKNLQAANAAEFNSMVDFFPEQRDQIYQQFKHQLPMLYLNKQVADPTRFLSANQAHEVIEEANRLDKQDLA